MSLFYELIFFLKIDEEDEDEDEEDDDMDNLKRILGTFIQTTRTSAHSPRLTPLRQCRARFRIRVFCSNPGFFFRWSVSEPGQVQPDPQP